MSRPQRDSDKEEDELKQKKLKEQYLRVFLTPEARLRLNNVKLVKPELAEAIEDQIIKLGAAGKITHAISDQELKSMLGRVDEPRREFKIKYL